jgi:Na+-driven multidrug efflux pump
LLVTVAGPAYAFTAPFLLLLTLAAVIEFSGFALEPAVVALGRPGTALAARVAASLLFVVLLFLLLDRYGPVGAPVAAIIASTALVLMTFVVAWRLTRAPK